MNYWIRARKRENNISTYTREKNIQNIGSAFILPTMYKMHMYLGKRICCSWENNFDFIITDLQSRKEWVQIWQYKEKKKHKKGGT